MIFSGAYGEEGVVVVDSILFLLLIMYMIQWIIAFARTDTGNMASKKEFRGFLFIPCYIIYFAIKCVVIGILDEYNKLSEE